MGHHDADAEYGIMVLSLKSKRNPALYYQEQHGQVSTDSDNLNSASR